ncbi:MAG: ribosome small subunit-dependent GTPase A [Clostridia bacterium]|nr:ribosome small subunit-dependent GTPase A [Clostridia bacterium]
MRQTQGVIVKGIGGFYYVRCDGIVHETRACGRFRKEKIVPHVGDRVVLSPEGDLITEILPRKNALIRPQVANIDLVVVVASPTSPVVDTFMIDAFLMTAASAGIEAMLCMNKSDIGGMEACQNICSIYEKAGYQTVITSVVKSSGLTELIPYLKDKITAFAGNSGVGKSSLLNLLGDNLCLETGKVSDKLARGRHTTRHVELYPLKIGGYVLDTPGFSRIQLPTDQCAELTSLYREFPQYAEACKFTGCAHMAEPECGVKEAVRKGLIAPQRYESYRYYYQKIKEGNS